ncbi:MAG: nuclear transport factor 2 family protein, partial [Cyanobacteria bacterium P01_A01_bin.40]
MIVRIIAFTISLIIVTMLPTPMNSETKFQTLVERQATAWETQDLSSLLDDFAPDAVFKAAGFTFMGVDAIQKAA